MEITHEITDIFSAHHDYTPNSTDFEFAETLFKMDGYHHHIEVRRGMDDSAFLYWTDGILNEWCEHYDTLAIALARLSILLECLEANDKRRFFAQSPLAFARAFKSLSEIARH